jgi:hypothetical protein
MGGVAKAAGNLVQGVVDFGGKVVNTVVKTAENIIKNPLPTIETIALTVAGVPAPISSAIVTGMNGGSVEDMAKAALASSAPSAGSYISDQLGIPSVAGTAIASTGIQVALGVPLDKAIANSASSAVISTGSSLAASQINDMLQNPTVSNALTKAGTNMVTTALSGGTSDQIGNALSTSLAGSGFNIAKDYFLSPSSNPFPAPLPADFGQSESLMPTNEAPLSSQPIDTSVNPNYSFIPPLSASNLAANEVNPETGAGMQAPLSTTGANNVGFTPVDYTLTGPLTGAPALQIPTSPAIKSMGGGQGLTAPTVTGPDNTPAVVGALGVTPQGAAPVLGNPASFINNPNITGQPVMPVDPAYLPTQGASGKITQHAPLSTVSSAPTTFNPQELSNLAPTDTTSTSTSTTAAPLPGFLTPTWLNTAIPKNKNDILGKLVQLYPEFGDTDPKLLNSLIDTLPEQDSSMPITSPLTAQQQQIPTYLSPTADTSPGNQEYPTSNLMAYGLNAISGQRPMYKSGGSVASPLQNALKTQNANSSDAYFRRFMDAQDEQHAANLIQNGLKMIQPTGAPSVLPTLGSYALGGTIHQQEYGHTPEFVTGQTGHYVKGRGDGQSDDIPAMLADGEYVFDADTVAALGNGSSDAGAKRLDEMREAIRKHKRSAPVDKIPPKAKSPLEYLKG